MKTEITLTLNKEVDALEAYRYFKRLEQYVKAHFKNVTDFICQKNLHSLDVKVSFSHMGQETPDESLVFPNILTNV